MGGRGVTDFSNESNLHLLVLECCIYTVEAVITAMWPVAISLNQPDYGMRDTPPIRVYGVEIFDRKCRFARIIYLAHSIWQFP